MAAYASVVSLMHVIDQLELHPQPPISLDKQQVASLNQKVTILQEFLEGYDSHAGYNNEAGDLVTRIADAANAAEDIIESHVVDQVLAGSTGHGKKRISSDEFYRSLQKVIVDMDLIKKEVESIKEKVGVQDNLNQNSIDSAGSSRSASTLVVGFDDITYQMKDQLIGSGGQLDRQIIPIVGMPGIGKTTLARNLYQDKVVAHHFQILAWSTVSQDYKLTKILLELLQEREDSLRYMDENDLADKLYKRLKGRRYLVIMDDIWDVKVWYRLRFFFPDDNNGSRIILTTRLSNLASQITNIVGINMTLLDEDNSWELFSKTVFGEEPCPLELEETGKMIVKNCKGLPLSIVVVGGLLANSKPTPEYWESIAKKLNSDITSEDGERCFKILHMSYNHLPVYLKPCFLYMGVFGEDSEIRFTVLIKLWVEEGFLKPISGKSSEIVAEECLKELIDRNLILVHELGSAGNIKYCKIHDLLRELSIREAEKERFYNVINQPDKYTDQPQRRIVIPESMTEEEVPITCQSIQLVRSLICDVDGTLESLNFPLLRIFEATAKYLESRSYCLEDLFKLVKSRYLAVRLQDFKFPSSIYLLWNLHTLIIYNDSGEEEYDIIAPFEIWNMPQLKHIDVGALYLPDPPSHEIIMANLQTMKTVMNFKCGEEVVEKIPNVKKLSVTYRELIEDNGLNLTNNINRLQKLESFNFYISDPDAELSYTAEVVRSITFPESLKKLTIGGNNVYWEDILGKISWLSLQVLKLLDVSFKGRRWETVDGQFPHLKFLMIEDCEDLEYWESESSHFPRLERLVLRLLKSLKEIPLSVAEIATLKRIELGYCRNSLVISAKRIQEEQEDLFGTESTQVQVVDFVTMKSEAIESLATPNFQVRYLDQHPFFRSFAENRED